jgi:hypothetical protein
VFGAFDDNLKLFDNTPLRQHLSADQSNMNLTPHQNPSTIQSRVQSKPVFLPRSDQATINQLSAGVSPQNTLRLAVVSSSNQPQNACRNYSKTKNCRYREHCKFAHIDTCALESISSASLLPNIVPSAALSSDIATTNEIATKNVTVGADRSSSFDELLMDFSLTPLIKRSRTLTEDGENSTHSLNIDGNSPVLCQSPTQHRSFSSQSQDRDDEMHTPASQLPPRSPTPPPRTPVEASGDDWSWNLDDPALRTTQAATNSAFSFNTVRPSVPNPVLVAIAVAAPSASTSNVTSIANNSSSATAVNMPSCTQTNQLDLEDIFAEYPSSTTAPVLNITTTDASSIVVPVDRLFLEPQYKTVVPLIEEGALTISPPPPQTLSASSVSSSTSSASVVNLSDHMASGFDESSKPDFPTFQTGVLNIKNYLNLLLLYEYFLKI